MSKVKKLFKSVMGATESTNSNCQFCLREFTSTSDCVILQGVQGQVHERCANFASKRSRVLRYTTEELDEIRSLRPTEWKKIMQERHAAELEKVHNEFNSENQQLDRQLKHREREFVIKKEHLHQHHEDRLQEIKDTSAKKIENVQEDTRKKREEHMIMMENAKTDHMAAMKIKEKEVDELKKKTDEIRERFQEAMVQQDEFIQKKEEETEHAFDKKWNEQKVKFDQDTLDLDAKMKQQELQFEKNMKEKEIAIQKEFDSQFTTELKITKADGSTLEMREKSPGIVTEYIQQINSVSNDPLSSADENN